MTLMYDPFSSPLETAFEDLNKAAATLELSIDTYVTGSQHDNAISLLHMLMAACNQSLRVANYVAPTP